MSRLYLVHINVLWDDYCNLRNDQWTFVGCKLKVPPDWKADFMKQSQDQQHNFDTEHRDLNFASDWPANNYLQSTVTAFATVDWSIKLLRSCSCIKLQNLTSQIKDDPTPEKNFSHGNFTLQEVL